MKKCLWVLGSLLLVLVLSGCGAWWQNFRRSVGGQFGPDISLGTVGFSVEFHPRDHRERVNYALEHNDPELPLATDWVLRQMRVARSREFPTGEARVIQTRYLDEPDRWLAEVPHGQVFRGDDQRLYAVMDFPLRSQELVPDGSNMTQYLHCLNESRAPQTCLRPSLLAQLNQTVEDLNLLDQQLESMRRRLENVQTPLVERLQVRREYAGVLAVREEMIRERDQLAQHRDLQLSDPQGLVGLIAANDLFVPYVATRLDGLTESEARFLCEAEVLWRHEDRTARQGRGEVNYVVRSRSELPLAAPPAAAPSSELEPGV